VRVLLVDDYQLFLEGLRSLLARQGVDVVGLARDGFEALQMARALNPELVLMDVKMPRCNGVDATRLIKAEIPACTIIMLTVSEDEDDLFEAVKFGASGYLLKHLNAEDFFVYLTDAYAGRAVFSHNLAIKILDEFKRATCRPQERPAVSSGERGQSGLSPRQLQILTLIAEGHTYKQVAEIVGVSERTVKYHMGEILDHLHLENRAQAIAYAVEKGFLRPDSTPKDQ
jgi:two-component system NarL family response regulator